MGVTLYSKDERKDISMSYSTFDFLRTSVAGSYRHTNTPITPEVRSFFKQSDVEGEVGLLTCIGLWDHLRDKEWSDLNIEGAYVAQEFWWLDGFKELIKYCVETNQGFEWT
jgi:hypothetical protein